MAPDDARFLATVLAPDMVAVSIPVSMANRQAKLVSPGNRVDVLLAVEQEGELVVGTIVEDARVIAVNSRVIADEDVGLGERNNADANGDGSPEEGLPNARPEVITVTLEVRRWRANIWRLGPTRGSCPSPSDRLRPRRGAGRAPAELAVRPQAAGACTWAVDRSCSAAASVGVGAGGPGASEETVVFAGDGGDSGLAEPSPSAGTDAPQVITGASPSLPVTRTR